MFSKSLFFALCLTSFFFFSATNGIAEPQQKVASDSRCSICGMFVAKYPAWITEIIHADGKVEFFDGVKDMMVYTFHPDQYGSKAKNDIVEIWVKDYYSLTYIDGKTAFYVLESDVYGPMGYEFIPFATLEAAQAFAKDHHGKDIVSFNQITEDMVEAMRSGHKMK